MTGALICTVQAEGTWGTLCATDGPEAAGGTRAGACVGVRLSATGTETLPRTVLAPLPHLGNCDRKYEMVTCDLPPSPLSYI